jgi:signal transduction histidine kinase
MEVELARQLIQRSDSEGAYGVLADTRDDLVELIAEVRRLISGTESSPKGRMEMVEAIREMLGRMNRAVGARVEITLRMDQEIHAVTSGIGWAAFSIVREAVINVLKHSTARNCLVALRTEGGSLRVVIVDDGYVPRQPRRRDGHGLANMAARAEEVGGWCIARPGRRGGFIVSAHLPLSQETLLYQESTGNHGPFGQKVYRHPNCR